MAKKSQVTIFIIIGLFIISALAIFFYSKGTIDKKIEDEARFSSQLISEPDKFDNYIRSCLEDIKPLISEIALKGGTLKDSTSRKYENISYNYACLNSHGCVNQLRTRKSMEEELSKEMLKILPLCLDISKFKSLGYKVKEGDMDLKVTIGTDTISLILNYPLEIEHAGSKYTGDKFTLTIKSNLGKLYDLSVHILNSEIENSNFRKELWMKDHPEIEIDKHKPYPDTVYSLRNYNPQTRELLLYNFAVQGDDTVSKIGTSIRRPNLIGYCYMENEKNCFANSEESKCIGAGGIWSMNSPESCTGLSTYETSNKPYSDCGFHKHGESWCDYDTITGAGLDYVGSRHYLKSCFDGRIFIEECRDYREELCAESDGEAACRPNRWKDCVLQNNMDDCEDSEKRDCMWDSTLQKSYI